MLRKDASLGDGEKKFILERLQGNLDQRQRSDFLADFEKKFEAVREEAADVRRQFKEASKDQLAKSLSAS